MRRFVMVVVMLVVVAVVAGCASGQKPVAASTTTTHGVAAVEPREAVRLTYPVVGVALAAVPSGYRAPVSRTEVLRLLQRTNHEPTSTTRPTVRLWRVREPGSTFGYPAWVVTFHHTRPTALGVPPTPTCTAVSIYNLRSRVWTWHFQLCPDRMPSRPNCDYGCTPANEPTLDAAAQAAQKVAGPRYYTGVAVNIAANTVTLYLANAPQSILTRLNASHPGRYAIHNDAPRPLRAVKKLMHSFNFKALKAQGITISGYGPTDDGYLQVGVTSHVAEAQADLNARYGRNVIHVVKQPIAMSTLDG
jgi:hypothetical protein